MTTTGARAWVADLYDDYVTTTVDVPFFLEEARRAGGPVLELMAGTGRLSLPLAEAGAVLTCVDLSAAMLVRLGEKLQARGLAATVVEANVCSLDLPEKDFALVLLPFQSFAELLTDAEQAAALRVAAAHLRPGGRLICTLHNPAVRLRDVDGQLRLLGTVPLSNRAGTLMLWSVQRREGAGPVVRAAQIYEIYDHDGLMEERRWLDVRFRLVERGEFQALAEAAGLRVVALYGDYERAPFIPEHSSYLIWVLERPA